MADATESPFFNVKREQGVNVIRLSRADVVDASYIESLGKDLQKYAMATEKPHFVLEMSAVRQLSSGALGVLVNLNNTVRNRGGGMCIAGLESRLREVFKLTKLHKVITICDDIPAAKEQLGVG